MVTTFLVFLSFVFVFVAHSKSVYPVSTPAGGRDDVHGWLILPIDVPKSSNNSLVRPAWFSHHVPEFDHNSPHNFQIVLLGTISPTSSVGPESELLPLNLPVLHGDDRLIYEYSITPPSPFSLNDLLNGDIKVLNGIYYNGSFDTPYDRIPESLSTVKILDLTTAVYLDEFEPNPYTDLTYLSYPRALPEISHAVSDYFYLAHSVRAQPDFDHVVHGTMKNCVSKTLSDDLVAKELNRGGIAWKVPGVANVLENKLKGGDVFDITSTSKDITCQLTVLESIHCMIGPWFMDNC